MRLAPSRPFAAMMLVAATLALMIALASEWFGGLVPCALCLVERWPYRVLIVLGIIAVLLPTRPRVWVLGLSLLVWLAAVGAAATHVGVEQGLWPSPLPECAAPRVDTSSIAARLASMPARPSKPCDEPTYLIPGLAVSMAAMNLLFALAGTACLAICVAGVTREDRRP
jgi:disulfide bond formation protein DsbB